ncbi:MAG: DUF4345 family protein [Porticoccaceae bacterium]
MLAKLLLWISAIAFAGYGLLCAIQPEVAAGYAGLGLTNADARIEMGAMYGGLQIGVGLFCMLAAVNDHYRMPGLVVIALLVGGLATMRSYGLATASGDVTLYTTGAVSFELLTTVIALICIAMERKHQPAL